MIPYLVAYASHKLRRMAREVKLLGSRALDISMPVRSNIVIEGSQTAYIMMERSVSRLPIVSPKSHT